MFVKPLILILLCTVKVFNVERISQQQVNKQVNENNDRRLRLQKKNLFLKWKDEIVVISDRQGTSLSYLTLKTNDLRYYRQRLDSDGE